MPTFDLLLQLWGGTGYLLAKIFLAWAEGRTEDRSWRLAGWSAYLLGLPAWVILLLGQSDWIAAAIEVGGAPALALGLIRAWRRSSQVAGVWDRAVKVLIYLLIAAGLAFSLRHHQGLNAVSQFLELGVTAGFLMGGYLLAKKNPSGWLWFALMLLCMGTLMLVQDKPILAGQQALSLIFVVGGFLRARRRPAA